jgi:putative transposase
MSDQFVRRTAELGIRRSVGRTGSCYDNALAESFNASLKVERVNRTHYATLQDARRDIVRYIEFRYNRRRLHSALGYRTPEEAYEDYINNHKTQLAA